MKLKEVTGISEQVRKRVYARDSFDDWPCCIRCGSPYHIEIHHFVERSRGGMGIEENLVCLCAYCHSKLHNGDRSVRDFCEEYLKAEYPGWEESKVIYRRQN